MAEKENHPEVEQELAFHSQTEGITIWFNLKNLIKPVNKAQWFKPFKINYSSV